MTKRTKTASKKRGKKPAAKKQPREDVNQIATRLRQAIENR